MKRLTLAMVALLFAVVVNAQDHQPPKHPSVEDHLKHFGERLDKEMTLSAEQKQKVLAAYKELFTKMDQLHAKYPPPPPPPPPPAPPAEMRVEMDKLVAVKDKEIKGILTAEQFKRLKEFDNRRHREHVDIMHPAPAAQ